MKYLNIVLTVVALLAAHLFLTGWGIVAVCICLGAGLATGFGRRPYPLVTILLTETIIGICFFFFEWDKGQLQALAGNFGDSPGLIAAAIIGINLVTTLTCTGSSFSLARWMLHFKFLNQPDKQRS